MKAPSPAALLKAAAAVSKQAHAPYSKYRVGAALLTKNGKVFAGCNVENASYGLTICAERNAIFAAVAQGHRKFRAVAIVASGKVVPFPCGACRQVLSEFCEPGMPVYIASVRNLSRYEESTIGELLPRSFKL